MDHLRKVQSGQKLEIPAGTFNAFVDAAKDLRSRQQSRRQEHEPRYPNSGVVKVRNQSGQDRDRFDVLGLVSPIIDPAANLQAFSNEPALEGVRPEDPDHFGKFAILLEPVKDGQIAHCACVSGVTPARVNVTKEWHDRADVRRDDPTCLESGEYGSAMILWKQPGKGLKWALVKIGLPYDEAFWARIAACMKVGPNKWMYSFVEVVHDDGTYGYGAWVAKPDGRPIHLHLRPGGPLHALGQSASGPNQLDLRCGRADQGDGLGQRHQGDVRVRRGRPRDPRGQSQVGRFGHLAV